MISPSMTVKDRLIRADWHMNKAEKLLDEYHNPKSLSASGPVIAAEVHVGLARALFKSVRELTR